MDKLCVALFIFRSVMKQKMYKEGLNTWTLQFKICNLIFFMSLKYLKEHKRVLYVSFNDRVFIKKIFNAGYTILVNQIIFNERYFGEHKEEIDKFFDRVEQISSMKGDLHSYQLVNCNLKKYVGDADKILD